MLYLIRKEGKEWHRVKGTRVPTLQKNKTRAITFIARPILHRFYIKTIDICI